jgi:hypothetical protein
MFAKVCENGRNHSKAEKEEITQKHKQHCIIKRLLVSFLGKRVGLKIIKSKKDNEMASLIMF